MKKRPGRLVVSASLSVFLAVSCTTSQRPSDTASMRRIESSPAVSTGAGGENPDSSKQAAAIASTQAASQTGAIGFWAVNMVETAPASTFPSTTAEADPTQSQPGREINELNSEEFKSYPEGLGARIAGVKDGAISSSVGAVNAMPPTLLNFEGNSSANNTSFFGSTVAPPDTNGAIGPNHYVQMVNNLVGIYNRSTGALIGGRFPPTAVFSALGGLCSNTNDGDPVVLYDKLADRWILSQFGFTGTTTPPYHECVAVSKTPDPTGAYYAYDFVLPGQQFPDYPKLGTWPDAYYMTTNQFFLGGGGDGAGAFAFDRAKMLVGDPTAGAIYFNLCFNAAHCTPNHPEGIAGMLPSDFDGLTPPPAGAKNIFTYPLSVTFGDATDGARLFEFTPNFASPGSSTFLERADSPALLAAYDGRNPSGRGDVREPSPGENLESLAGRFMHRFQYQNRGGTETWVSNITVNVGTGTVNATNYRAAPRYFELRRTSPGGAITTFEQATFAPDPVTANRGRWMGSAAEDASGNLALGYSRTSTTAGDFASIMYAGRLSTDPPGGLAQGEATLFAGLGTQTGTSNRWGDYSAMQIDPVDFCTFWFTNEYYPAGNTSFNWRTRIGSFKFPSCVSPARGTLTGLVTYCQNSQPIKGAVISVSDGHGGATIANGTYSVTLPPGTYTVTATDPFANCATSTSQQVTISNGGTATANFCLTGTPLINLVGDSFDDSSGNNNGVINRDECFKVNATLENDGCLPETGISAVLSTSTPGVVVDQAFSNYPNLAINGNGGNLTPYRAHTTPGFVCGTDIQFTLTETSTLGGGRVFHFSFPTCHGAPVPFSGVLDGSESTENSRNGRNAVSSVCGTAKACPAPFDTAARFFDTFSFTNTSTVTNCLTVTLDQTACSGALLGVGYMDTFVPSNICTNYLGDEGASPSVGSFSVNIPAGHSLVLAVQQTTVGTLCAAGYSGTISGLIDNTPAGASKLEALSPAHEWIGLKNSDDVGTNFDLKAEVYRNGTLVGSGEVDNVSGGSSGFNNARDRAITLALNSAGTDPVCSGDTLSITLSVKVTATGGHNTGTARLWYNDAQANTRFDATIGGTNMNLYLLDGFLLGTSQGVGPKKTIDVLVGRTTWKTFGTWIKTF